MFMQKSLKRFLGAVLSVSLLGAACVVAASTVDDDLFAVRRIFPKFGPGLRALRRGSDGKYYLLASPNVGVAILDAQGKQVGSLGSVQQAPSVDKPGSSLIAFGEDCDIDAQGRIYVAD